LGQGGLGDEPLGNHLIGCLAFQYTLAAGVVGGIEAAQKLFELIVRIDGDGEHFGDDAAIEPLDHAIGLRRAWLDMAIGGSEFGADLGKGLGEAAAVVCQYVCHANGQSRGRFAQESDGTGFGFVVLDGEVDRARAAVDGDVEIALAPFAIGGLQLGRSSPRFQPRSGWNGCGGRCLMSIWTKPRS
jgi:hypothetical protein